MTARAAEALEHQARYRDMFNDPRYQRYAKVERTSLGRAIGGDAGYAEERLANIAVLTATVAANNGEAYWWEPNICGLIETVAPAMPPWVMTREALPAPSGFFWFDRPIKTSSGRRIKAFFWGLIKLHPDYDNGPKEKASMLAVQGISARPEDMMTARGVAATTLEDGAGEPMLVMDRTKFPPEPIYTNPRWERPKSTVMWSFDRGSEDIIETNLNPALNELDDSGDGNAAGETQVLAACFAFLQQRFLTKHRQKITQRGAVRRLAKANIHHPEVRVVALRKAFARASGADRMSGDPVNWSCRWIVQGFWRNQWMPSTNSHQPIYILPYMKGPDDKPLKGISPNVFSVHR